MFDKLGRYVMEDYAIKSTFASFLPGIAGRMGIPLWCFYVNRGQAVCSFGVSDKEHSIMEFYPAHQSYRNVSTTGFRTFLKIDGQYYEPFRDDTVKKKMYIGMNELEIEETSIEKGIAINVRYFTLSHEDVAALARVVTVTNLGDKPKDIEILDGMPAIIPYGISQGTMKMMGQTAKAWMQVEDVENALPYYRVRFTSNDTAEVKKIDEGNFYFTLEASGKRLPVIADPDVVFEYNTALTEAVGFRDNPMATLLAKKQVTQNNVPTAFFGRTEKLSGGASTTHYSVMGQAACKEQLLELAERISNVKYFEEKYKQARSLTKDLCAVIGTKSGNPIFDAYCEQSYLDNLLRGGYPITLGSNIYYLYSRKHGDIERDYNFFAMLPEFFSQGNANFRDINQNRRSDILFTPYVKDINIKTFYNLIQLDGYNPLAVEMDRYGVNNDCLPNVLESFSDSHKNKVADFLTKTFTPGSLTSFLLREKIVEREAFPDVLETVMTHANRLQKASFGDGYWSDHWTYNLDLINTYLAVYPDDEERLLFDDASYTYYESKALVNPRSKRYCLTENGVRQYHALDEHSKKNISHPAAKTQYGKGEDYCSNLASKLLMLAMNKFAALDSHGMGIEMEGGKPGWYDALNGMPGIFGSSMAETYELARMLEFIIDRIVPYNRSVSVPSEAALLINEIVKLLSAHSEGNLTEHEYWDLVNTEKEKYWEKIAFGVAGDEVSYSVQEWSGIVKNWLDKVYQGIERAMAYANGVSPCYFAYELSEYEMCGDVIKPKAFTPIVMPEFLEGSVRYLKLKNPSVSAAGLYAKVKASSLYDQKLGMYKVNGPLDDASYEIGRAKAFTPGWLENESVWLHMEYKYVLALLNAGLYEEFFIELKNTCIPFLNADTYGRSPLENSSFIASSANPNENIHGKGFVARLSGATAEFINMWQVMMFGKNPFTMSDGALIFEPKPAIPDCLLDTEGSLECTLLGTTTVRYLSDQHCDLIPGKYRIERITLNRRDDSVQIINGGIISGTWANAIRDCQVKHIEVRVTQLQ